MKLSIIIVSYNTKKFLRSCLSSIKVGGLNEKDYEVFVVDNASGDGSVGMVGKRFSKAKLIVNRKNVGFAKANNRAIRKAKGEYILLLNSDAEVEEGALACLVQFMESHKRVGIASAQLLNEDESIQQSGGFVPKILNVAAWMFFLDDLPIVRRFFWSYHKTDENFYKKTREVGWVQGAAMMLRKRALDEIGFLDEEIFMYGEDVDLCMRANKKGWQVWSVAEAKVKHYGFKSSNTGVKNALLGEYKGLRYIFSKHKYSWEQLLLRALLKLGAVLRMFIFGTIFGDKERYAIYAQAFKLA